MKLAIVVRKDLGMRCGKIAVQVGHASVEACRRLLSPTYDRWLDEGQKKIVLKVDSEQALLDVSAKACYSRINVAPIRDFGLTQVEPNTLTCIAIGPDEDEKIDEITKGLSLL